MKKSLLVLAMAGVSLCAFSQDEITYNFFDPEDCDADGWLWLDTQEKIDKYVGEGKKIQLVNAQYSLPDPDFPGEDYVPESYVDANIPGYNTEGVAGGAGSKTGGIILPGADWEGWFPAEGGGILVKMPDCAQFDVYVSAPHPVIYSAIYGAEVETDDPADCGYIWDGSYDWYEDKDFPVTTDYVGWDMNIQNYVGTDWGDGGLTIFGEKGCGGRTALYYNYSEDYGEIYLQGLHIRTFTSVSSDTGSGVKSIEQENLKIAVNDGIVSVSSATQISVYSASGVQVASTYGTSLDCSSLKGIYFVKAGNKTIKAVF